MTEIINPTKYYSPRKLVAMDILPWKSAMTFKKKLGEPRWKQLFNPFTEIVNGQTVHRVKGSNIIKFIELTSQGQIN